mmetsp:Transcript_6141/g.16870  ORF Transcript_6141/g.16870 Transcript_6141/m.16870 type:complete len:417 (+) Transcript_6141:198-1448(+)
MKEVASDSKSVPTVAAAHGENGEVGVHEVAVRGGPGEEPQLLRAVEEKHEGLSGAVELRSWLPRLRREAAEDAALGVRDDHDRLLALGEIPVQGRHGDAMGLRRVSQHPLDRAGRPEAHWQEVGDELGQCAREQCLAGGRVLGSQDDPLQPTLGLRLLALFLGSVPPPPSTMPRGGGRGGRGRPREEGLPRAAQEGPRRRGRERRRLGRRLGRLGRRRWRCRDLPPHGDPTPDGRGSALGALRCRCPTRRPSGRLQLRHAIRASKRHASAGDRLRRRVLLRRVHGVQQDLRGLVERVPRLQSKQHPPRLRRKLVAREEPATIQRPHVQLQEESDRAAAELRGRSEALDRHGDRAALQQVPHLQVYPVLLRAVPPQSFCVGSRLEVDGVVPQRELPRHLLTRRAVQCGVPALDELLR